MAGGSRPRSRWVGRRAAIAAAMALGFHGVFRWPQFPPHVVQGWLVYIALGAAMVGIAVALIQPRRWIEAVLSILVIAAAVWLLIQRQQQRMESPIFWRWAFGLTAAMVVWWIAISTLTRRVPGASLPMLLMLAIVASALALTNAATLSFGKLAGAMAAALWRDHACHDIRRQASITCGGVLVLAVLLLGLLICGYFYAELTLRDLVMLAAAPLAAWFGELPGLGPSRSWRRFSVARSLCSSSWRFPRSRPCAGCIRPCSKRRRAISCRRDSSRRRSPR